MFLPETATHQPASDRAVCRLLAWLTSPDFRSRITAAGAQFVVEGGITHRELATLLQLPTEILNLWIAQLMVAETGGEAIVHDDNGLEVAHVRLMRKAMN